METAMQHQWSVSGVFV